MKVFHMTEQPYHPAWAEVGTNLSVTIPNQLCDPKIAADLYHRFYDEWCLADELGLDIMINEHHSTANCLSSAAVVPLSILARETRRARLLVLGYPIGLRPDPFRAAEELATVDVISRGRLEMGFVRGVPWEIPVANISGVELGRRFWEGLDFVIKAMTTHDGPFNWEGEFFHYRQVNLWPRPYQQPHPPVWMTTSNAENARLAGRRGYVIATLGNGYKARDIFDAYREGWAEAGRPGEPGPDRFAYLGLMATGTNEAEARRRGEVMLEFSKCLVGAPPQFRNPPGYIPAVDSARILKGSRGRPSFGKDGRPIYLVGAGLQDLIDAGIFFCGTPDQVREQITDFADAVGGLGNFLMMPQAAGLSHEDTVQNITLFAKEVLPALAEYRVRADRFVPASTSQSNTRYERW
jgi:alkanesulfonate monooxygenase SsuD/methylene tetrahydromethanopterin reductase-like flavin-dependent oxidoreductase (luciferase family)